MLVMQWARAEAEPSLRASLSRRRDQIAAAGELLIREGVATRRAAGLDRRRRRWRRPTCTFLDGLLLWRLEQGDAYRREEAERRALALLRPILASAAAAEAPSVPHVPAQVWSVTEKVREGPSLLGRTTSYCDTCE